MALVKRTYVDGETIITAQNLNDIQDEIISHANTFVPKTRTINSKALDANITLTASDLGAVPTTRTVNGKALSSNITLTAANVGAAPTSHASTATTYGKGTSSNYGHVKISDSLTDTTTAATGGVVPSMKAVSDLNSAINAITPLDTAPTSGSTKGITSGAVYTAEHTVTQPTVSRGNDIIAGTNLVLNDCRKFQKVVTYRAQLESKTSSEVTYPHNTVMFTGLPHPYQNIIFMANTFLENKSDQHQYRLVLTTGGDIKTYWDTAHVPKTGSAFLVDITYLTSE